MNEADLKKLVDALDPAALTLLAALTADKQKRLEQQTARQERWAKLKDVILADHRVGGPLYADVFEAFEALPCPTDDATIDDWQVFSLNVPAEPPSLENENLSMWRAHLAAFEDRLRPEPEVEVTEESEAEEPDVAEPDAEQSQIEGSEAEEPATEEPEVEDSEEVFELPGPRTTDGAAIRARLPGILHAMLSKPPLAPVRLGVDFGTSRSKIVARSTNDESIIGETFRNADDCVPSALAFSYQTGALRFGQDAIAEWLREPGAWLFQRSLKRVLLDGRVDNISKIDPRLTTGHAAVFTFAGLMLSAHERLRAAGVYLTGGPWLPTNLATPVIHPYKELQPFWGHTMNKTVNYPTYLRYLTVAGSALAVALDGAALDSWEPLLDAFYWLKTHIQPTTVEMTRQGRFTDITEPMGAIADFSARELGAGLHLVVDSGAGTTDWELIAVGDQTSCSLARHSAKFGGDDVDAVMLNLVKEDDVFPAAAHSWLPLVQHQLNELKPSLIASRSVDYTPLGIPGVSFPQTIGLEWSDVLHQLSSHQSNITQMLHSSFSRADQARSDSWENLSKQGFDPQSLARVSHVWLLGGNAGSPILHNALKNALSISGNSKASIDLLPVPLVEKNAGRLNPERFRLAAVATGASRNDHPSPGAIKKDHALPTGIGPDDKDSV